MYYLNRVRVVFFFFFCVIFGVSSPGGCGQKAILFYTPYSHRARSPRASPTSMLNNRKRIEYIICNNVIPISRIVYIMIIITVVEYALIGNGKWKKKKKMIITPQRRRIIRAPIPLHGDFFLIILFLPRDLLYKHIIHTHAHDCIINVI